MKGAACPTVELEGLQNRAAMPRATSAATVPTCIDSTVVNGAPTPAESYCQIPIPGCQYARG